MPLVHPHSHGLTEAQWLTLWTGWLCLLCASSDPQAKAYWTKTGHLRSQWLVGKGTGRLVASLSGHREGHRKQRAEETEEPQGRNTSAEGGEVNGGCLHCPGALWMSLHVPLSCPFCVTGVVPCTMQHCSCACVTGDMQVRTSAESWQRRGRCHKSPQAVWEMGDEQGMSELGLYAVSSLTWQTELVLVGSV